ncbi:hypothetical protein [Streptomyces sp. CB01201]|nr:hypothetical protein [Streptomyces sp. CB01201]
MNVLFHRFCSRELVQFEALRTNTQYGPVYILMTWSMSAEFEVVVLHDF